jgi:hypothetical protein
MQDIALKVVMPLQLVTLLVITPKAVVLLQLALPLAEIAKVLKV